MCHGSSPSKKLNVSDNGHNQYMHFIAWHAIQDELFSILLNEQCQGCSHDFVSRETKETSAQRAEIWGHRAESGCGFLGRGSQPLPTNQGVWWNVVSSTSGVRGTAPAAKRFSCIFIVQSGLYVQFIVVYCSLYRKNLDSLCSLCQGKSNEKQPRWLPCLPQWTPWHWMSWKINKYLNNSSLGKRLLIKSSVSNEDIPPYKQQL